MTNANDFRGFSPWVSALAVLGFLLLALPNSDTLAAPAKRNVSFDHVRTGFPLTGAHVTLPCETCHVQGTFKGTPKKCATCHTQGSRIQTTTFKPSNHIVTAQACDQCHTSTASWNVAFFSHAGVIAHQCGQCHNSNIAKGKPANHTPTNAPCDTCHRTTTWMSASFTHVSVMPGSCTTCHLPGGSGLAKPSNHIPTNLPCDACHTTGGSFTTSKFTHSATQSVMPGQCSTCHSGSYTQWNALGKPSGHVATTASCDTCHTGFQSFVTSSFNHSGVTMGSCATCHKTGGSGMAKPSNHIPTNLSCDACHNTSTFTTSTFTHSATQDVIAGQCATCHSGSYTQWNALGKPSGHVATTASCDTCHKGYSTFAGAGFNHTGVSPGSCTTCHIQGGSATAKPTNHMPTNLSCDACHSYTSPFTASTFTHSATQGIVAGQCITCHSGSYTQWNALGKPSNHIPTSASCDACHATGGTFTTSSFSHSATQGVLPGQCATCHSGAYTQWNALAKPSGHVATTASCDTCHTGYTTFAGAGFNHSGVSPGTCATCHVQGGSGMAKPSNHIPTTLSCDACHNTSTFTTSTFTHSSTQGVLPGQCSNCHNGSYTQWNALGKPSGHVATTASCDTCHKSYTTFTGATFNHTGVSPGTCSTCHYQGGPGLAKPTNHIPYESQLLAGASMNCDSCHKSTTSFATQTMNHNNSLGNGSGWCKGCHASGTSYLGSMEKKSLTHQQTTGVTDCSQSGCHRPLGNRGTPYNNWD